MLVVASGLMLAIDYGWHGSKDHSHTRENKIMYFKIPEKIENEDRCCLEAYCLRRLMQIHAVFQSKYISPSMKTRWNCF